MILKSEPKQKKTKQTIDGCPNTCSKHGQCVPILTAINNIGDNNRDDDDFDGIDIDGDNNNNNNIEWRCQCNNGWDGHDCSAPQETNCNDEIDNDNGNWI